MPVITWDLAWQFPSLLLASNSKVRLFSTQSPCPMQHQTWPCRQQPIFLLPSKRNADSQPPVLMILESKIKPCRCVANTGVAVQLGRCFVFKGAVPFLFIPYFTTSWQSVPGFQEDVTVSGDLLCLSCSRACSASHAFTLLSWKQRGCIWLCTKGQFCTPAFMKHVGELVYQK